MLSDLRHFRDNGFVDDYTDPFVYAPSFLLAGAGLCEGKALGTAAHADLSLVKNYVTAGLPTYPYAPGSEGFSNELKKGQTIGRRKLLEVQKRTRSILLGLIGSYQSKKIDEAGFRKATTKTMKSAWRDVFLAGVRAGGTQGEGAGKGKLLVNLEAGVDDRWIKSAMQHEMRFLNRFLTAIVEDDYTMSLERRADMYVRALTSFYESSRVVALPNNVLIHWLGPNDKRTCVSCQYLFEQSPFTKMNLPCVPRSGNTLCLTNCRDRLYIRRVDVSEVSKRLEESEYTRGGHIANLRKMKRTGKR